MSKVESQGGHGVWELLDTALKVRVHGACSECGATAPLFLCERAVV